MPKKPDPDKVPKAEADKRRDDALRTMLKTPPRPHKSSGKTKDSKKKAGVV